jgi:pseudaminic acid synthase
MRPKIVAEISANHNGSPGRAHDLICAAKVAGADAVKLQAYRAGDLTLDRAGPGFTIEAGPWAGRTLIDLYREAETPLEWLPDLFARARRVGIECFASVFAPGTIDFLETLGCPAYKIASFEMVDTGLIAAAAKTGKPLVISTGMASDAEIIDALDAAGGGHNVTLLHCVSAYPTPPASADLRRIHHLRQTFAIDVGLSDHTLGTSIPVAATALGVTMIEKHLTLSRSGGGPDAAFSLEPGEFAAMVEAVRDVASAMERPIHPEAPHFDLRRSLYAVADIRAGEAITEQNVRSIRPGHGLAPRYLPEILGKTAICDIGRGTPMAMGLVK